MKQTYQELKAQLDTIMLKLQDEELDIDEAVKLHASGQKLVGELETYLKKVKLEVTKHKPE